MADRLVDKLVEYLQLSEGKTVDLKDIRVYLKIEPGSTDDANLRMQMATAMVKRKIVVPSGKKDGNYKVIKRVEAVRVFQPDRKRRLPYELRFPRDFTTDMELLFAEFVVLREGDLITIGGTKSSGKTQLCLSFCAENIDTFPILMGNEYTILTEDRYEPSSRFLDRLDRMSEWVQWVKGDGMDKFTLLPVNEDYAEHIVNGRLNLIDWIDLEGDRSYDIGKILKGIKTNNGRGISIAALQKGEGKLNPRGDQYARDYSDLEIMLDPFGKNPHEVLLTIRGVKESTKPIAGKTYAYTIGEGGTRIFNFREVKKCKGCMGTGHWKGHACEECYGIGMVDR